MLRHFLRWPPSEGWQRNLETRENSQVLMFSIRFTWMHIGGLEVHAKCRAAGRCTGCNQGLPLVQHHEAKRSEQKDVNTGSWVIGDQCLRGHKRTQQFRPFWQGISAMICHDVPQVWKKTKRTTYKHTPAHSGKHQWTRHHQICYRLLSAGSGWKKVLPSTTSTSATHQHTIPHPSCHEAIPVQISAFQHSNSPKYAEMKRNDWQNDKVWKTSCKIGEMRWTTSSSFIFLSLPRIPRHQHRTMVWKVVSRTQLSRGRSLRLNLDFSDYYYRCLNLTRKCSLFLLLKLWSWSQSQGFSKGLRNIHIHIYIYIYIYIHIIYIYIIINYI